NVRDVCALKQAQRLGSRDVIFLRVWLRRPLDVWSSSNEPVVLCPLQHHAQMTELGVNGSVLDPGIPSLERVSSAIVYGNGSTLELGKSQLEGFPCVFHRLEDCQPFLGVSVRAPKVFNL